MPKLSIFPQDVLRKYADLIHGRLGVQIVIRGREICADLKRKVIYLPNLEGVTEEQLRPLLGFALHEAAHIRWTRLRVLKQIDNFLLRDVQGWAEDEFIERKLCSRIPGARERLHFSHETGYTAKLEGELGTAKDGKCLTLFRVSDRGYLNDADHLKEMITSLGRQMLAQRGVANPTDAEAHTAMVEAVRGRMTKLGLPNADVDVLRELAKRFEISFFLWLWSCEWRDFSNEKIRAMYRDHPWRPVLERLTRKKTRNSFDCLERAKDLIETLDVHPVLPWDSRDLAEARGRAAAAREAVREAKRQHEKARQAIAEDAKAEADTSIKGKLLREAEDKLKGADKAADAAIERSRQARERLRVAREACEGVGGESDFGILKRRQDELAEALKEANEAHAEVCRAEGPLVAAQAEADAARKEYTSRLREILRRKVRENKERLAQLKQAIKDRRAEANTTVAEVCAHENAIRVGDKEVGQEFTDDELRQIVQAVLAALRATTVEEELGEAMPRKGVESKTAKAILDAISGERKPVPVIPPKPEAALSARRYLPYDRSLDAVDRVLDTPESASEYAKVVGEHREVIQEALEHLRRLYSPTLSGLKPNAARGRLDPRQAYRLGLALRGASVDVSRVWRKLDVKRDPKVAVCLLVDCSGSMHCEKMELAQAAACCLSEVMRGLNIPHEILGHTTDQSKMTSDPPAELRNDYSRFVPFQGLVFKEFAESKTPTSLFGKIAMGANLDGEAVLWTLERLAQRSERTKLCIVLSDGMPAAAYSSIPELERHLYTVAKRAEGFERDGLLLVGLGIKQDRVREFYGNAAVINAVEDLPKATLGIVEAVLGRVVGTMA